ncbi:MAG: hypothetical protein K8S56_05645 [Candidatus Cloacimonetes bacterium]|nr:hypothetical protein [Candidatus Cloacimonadota bacterium]
MKILIILLLNILLLGCSDINNNKKETESSEAKELKMAGFELSGKSHHFMGIELNNQVWNLLQKENRTPEDINRMINYALASQHHWYKSPHWQPVNAQRGEWMISHVFAVSGIGESALKHARNCLRLTEEHAFNDFDLAYAYEAMARAYSSLKDKDNYQKYYQLAEEAGNNIASEEDKSVFMGDLKADPWMGK